MATFADTSGHAGDEGNFEALYETYKSDVQRLASYLLRNATDAEDAAQTVFLNVLRALRQGVTPTDPRAWLLAITRNVCFSRRRAASARPLQVELEPELMSSEPDPDSGPSADEIVGALARLLPNQRTALILRDFRGVSRPEICSLMALSPVALEALLTRSRAAFREELEAGEQPFACDETRLLVEQQLDGLITVADRHSLRTHLRHCAPCSTLARAVRSSRGKLAALLFWPAEMISRLAGAFSQAPTAMHVAAALTSSAAVATIAIPVAVTTGPSAAHIGGRTVPWPAPVVQHSRVSPPSLPALARVAGAATAVFHTAPTTHVAAHRPSHTQSKPTHHVTPQHGSHATVKHAAAAPTSSATRPVTTVSGGITTPAQQTTQATAAPVQHAGVVLSHTAAPTRSSSPAIRPSSRPKPKPIKKAAKKKHSRHDPSPVHQMPASSAPAADMTPADGGAVDGAGSGVEIGAATSPAVVPPSSSDSSSGGSAGTSATSSSSGSGSSANGNGNGNGNGNNGDNGNGDKHKHKK